LRQLGVGPKNLFPKCHQGIALHFSQNSLRSFCASEISFSSSRRDFLDILNVLGKLRCLHPHYADFSLVRSRFLPFSHLTSSPLRVECRAVLPSFFFPPKAFYRSVARPPPPARLLVSKRLRESWFVHLRFEHLSWFFGSALPATNFPSSQGEHFWAFFSGCPLCLLFTLSSRISDELFSRSLFLSGPAGEGRLPSQSLKLCDVLLGEVRVQTFFQVKGIRWLLTMIGSYPHFNRLPLRKPPFI